MTDKQLQLKAVHLRKKTLEAIFTGQFYETYFFSGQKLKLRIPDFVTCSIIPSG